MSQAISCPGFNYTIRAGDTFFRLAQRFGTTVAAIQAANPGVDPNNLQIGQVSAFQPVQHQVLAPADVPMDFCILFSRVTRSSGWPSSELQLQHQAANPGLIPTTCRSAVICIPTGQHQVLFRAAPNGFLHTIQSGDTFLGWPSGSELQLKPFRQPIRGLIPTTCRSAR